MYKQAVAIAFLQRFHLDEFMAAMDHVSGMEAHYFRPPPLFKQFTRLFRGYFVFLKFILYSF